MNICTLSQVTGRFVTFETVFNCLTKLHITLSVSKVQLKFIYKHLINWHVRSKLLPIKKIKN